jgi:copper(I)-binding protein
MTHFRIVTAIVTILAGSAAAHDFTHGGLRIAHPHGFESLGASGAGYMTLTNEGDAVVTLLGARSDAVPRVELHTTEVDASGVARMIEQERIEIAPGETVSFEPGGLHVMFMGLTEPLEIGDRVPAELLFDTGAVSVEFWIEERKTGGSGGEGAAPMHHDHSGHRHGG